VEDEVNMTVSKNMGKKYITEKLHVATLSTDEHRGQQRRQDSYKEIAHADQDGHFLADEERRKDGLGRDKKFDEKEDDEERYTEAERHEHCGRPPL